MESSFEKILAEVLEWDRESQENLVGEIRRNLAEINESVYGEDYRHWQDRRRDDGQSMIEQHV